MAKISVTSPKETLDFKYNVNGTGDGIFTGTQQDAGITMYIYSVASVQYGDASTNTNTGVTSTIGSHNEVLGNLLVTVTNNGTSATEPVYFSVTTNTGATEFTNDINDTKTLLTTGTADGIIAGSGTGTGTIEVTHIGTSIDDTATFTINLFEKIGDSYEPLTPTQSGIVDVSVSAAVLGISTVVSGGPTINAGAYYIKSGDAFNYDITISNSGNVATTTSDTTIKIETDTTNLTLGSVKGYTDSGFTQNETTLTPVNGKYTIPVSIEPSTGAYYVRVTETAN